MKKFRMKMSMIVPIVLLPTVFTGIISAAPGTAAVLPPFSEISAIRIDDQWWGLSMVSPSSHYILIRGKNGFSGSAELSAGPKTSHKTETVSVPMDKVRAFLQLIGKAPAVEGPYHPTMTHTDDYPSIKITLVAAGGDASVFTQSQGVNNLPWGLSYKGKTYVIASDEPVRALKILNRYLKKDVLQGLIDEIVHHH